MQSKIDATYIELREKILFGELEPRSPMTFEHIIEHTGVSASMARELILSLGAGGYLTRRGRGHVVSSFTNEQVEEWRLALGAIVEIGALRLALVGGETLDAAEQFLNARSRPLPQARGILSFWLSRSLRSFWGEGAAHSHNWSSSSYRRRFSACNGCRMFTLSARAIWSKPPIAISKPRGQRTWRGCGRRAALSSMGPRRRCTNWPMRWLRIIPAQRQARWIPYDRAENHRSADLCR